MAAATLVAPNIEGARRLMKLMDAAGAPPRAVLWVFDPDRDAWRLWIAPSTLPGRGGAGTPPLREFYAFVAPLMVAHRGELGGLDSGEVHMVEPDHPAIVGLSRFVHVTDDSAVRTANNMLNGYFLPDAVVLRMPVAKAA